jgi:uncharacterized membrane protein YebE (DUF533 family)
MLTLTEQYMIDEAKFGLKDLYKPNEERGKEWAIKRKNKEIGKTVGKMLGSKDRIKTWNNDVDSTNKKINRSGAMGKHVGQAAGAAGAAGLAGAAYLAYKLYKKWKNKEKEADTPEEKELFRKKAASAKNRSQKLKAKKA